MLSIKHTDAGKPFFDCGSWSDFSSEREFLFLGGLQPMYFTSVRDIPTNSNYAKFIEPLSMLDDIFDGCPTVLRQPTLRDLKYMFHLIVDEIIGIDKFMKISNTSLTKFRISTYSPRAKPIFVVNLFKHWVYNITQIEINIRRFHFEKFNSTTFGFKLCRPLFYHDAKTPTTVNTQLLVTVFSNLKRIIILNQRMDYESSIDLDDAFLMDIVGTINILNQRNIKSTMEYIVIADPKGSISDFIQSHTDKFAALNWRIYADSWGDSFYGECDKCLYIVPN